MITINTQISLNYRIVYTTFCTASRHAYWTNPGSSTKTTLPLWLAYK